jgi:DNA-binding NarL/FixJ family response regulator
MNGNLKHTNAIAYLRQLCCSGLDKEIVIPEFLRAVQAVIPSGCNVFTGFDERMNPSYFMLEFVSDDLVEIAPLIINYFTLERRNLFVGWLQTHPVLTDPTVFDESFYKSDFYNVVYRPYDQHHGLWSLAIHHGNPVGILNLFRPINQKLFNCQEQALCTQLLPYVAHAFSTPKKGEIQYAENGTSGMMVMDTQGQIQYLSPEAKLLLAMACHPVLSLAARCQEEVLLVKLAKLCRNLQAIFQGKHAAPPSWSMTNVRGRFSFRACWLNKQNNEPGALIGMTVEHHEPLVLRLLRGLQNLPLSPVQKQVALLLAQGTSNEKIGAHLNIKLTTVKDHISKIFDKLGIYRREELLPLLLALDKSTLRVL